MNVSVRNPTKYRVEVLIETHDVRLRTQVAEMLNGKIYVPQHIIEDFIISARNMYCNDGEKNFIDFLAWQIDDMLDNDEKQLLIKKIN